MRSDAHLLLLDKHVVEAMLTPDDVLEAVREAFVLHSRDEGRVFPVIREQLATGGIFGVKAGDVPGQHLLGFKAAGFWPSNRQTGGEPHQATIVLIDPATGRPLCVIDGNAITTARTGAAGALGLQTLARSDSAELTVFGTGVQARSQLDFALRALPSIQRVNYVALNRQPDATFTQAFENRCELRCASDADAAVARSDIVITATPGAGPLFSEQAVQAGTHINAVGADTRGKRELPEGLLQRARVVADDRQQALQLGEMQWASQGACSELGDWLGQGDSFARGATDITVFDMTGLALQDLTVARLIHQKAQAAQAGIPVAWPW